MKLPNELYVRVEGEGDDEFLRAEADPEIFAVINENVTVALYRKVGLTYLRSSLQIIKPKA